MASSINASTSGAGGVITTADSSGVLNIQTAGNTAVTVNASQNVGIGTTSPAVKLDIRTNYAGDTSLNLYNEYSSAAYASNVNLIATNTSGSYYNAINSKNSAGTVTWAIDGAGSADTLAFKTGSSGTERMRIDSSGNLLIARTTILSAGKISIDFDQGANQAISMRNTNAANGANYILFLNSSSNQAGLITQTGATTVAYTTTSDYRMKENILPMVGALDKVAQLKPVTYKWKADGSDGQGFIAHELAEVIPDCVTGEKDAVETYTDEDGIEQTKIKPQGVDTSFLVATLTAAIKEQQTIINDLKARIETLEAK